MQVFDIAPQGSESHEQSVLLDVQKQLEGQLAAAEAGDKTVNLKSLGEAVDIFAGASKAVVARLEARAKAAELAKSGDTVGAITELRRHPNRMG